MIYHFLVFQADKLAFWVFCKMNKIITFFKHSLCNLMKSFIILKHFYVKMNSLKLFSNFDILSYIADVGNHFQWLFYDCYFHKLNLRMMYFLNHFLTWVVTIRLSGMVVFSCFFFWKIIVFSTSGFNLQFVTYQSGVKSFL